MYILEVLKLSSVIILASTAIVSFGLGLLYKKAFVIKQRKRILYLEDEMLANHANILELEKKLVEMRKERDEQSSFNVSKHKPSSDHGLRAS